MTFVALLFMNIGIVLLYAAYMNVSPFVVIRAFIEGKEINAVNE